MNVFLLLKPTVIWKKSYSDAIDDDELSDTESTTKGKDKGKKVKKTRKRQKKTDEEIGEEAKPKRKYVRKSKQVSVDKTQSSVESLPIDVGSGPDASSCSSIDKDANSIYRLTTHLEPVSIY